MTGSQGDHAVQSRENGVGGAGAEKSESTGALGSVGGRAREWWGPDPEQSRLRGEEMLSRQRQELPRPLCPDGGLGSIRLPCSAGLSDAPVFLGPVGAQDAKPGPLCSHGLADSAGTHGSPREACLVPWSPTSW